MNKIGGIVYGIFLASILSNSILKGQGTDSVPRKVRKWQFNVSIGNNFLIPKTGTYTNSYTGPPGFAHIFMDIDTKVSPQLTMGINGNFGWMRVFYVCKKFEFLWGIQNDIIWYRQFLRKEGWEGFYEGENYQGNYAERNNVLFYNSYISHSVRYYISPNIYLSIETGGGVIWPLVLWGYKYSETQKTQYTGLLNIGPFLNFPVKFEIGKAINNKKWVGVGISTQINDSYSLLIKPLHFPPYTKASIHEIGFNSPNFQYGNMYNTPDKFLFILFFLLLRM